MPRDSHAFVSPVTAACKSAGFPRSSLSRGLTRACGFASGSVGPLWQLLSGQVCDILAFFLLPILDRIQENVI